MFRTMEDFRDVMETGIEELDLPPLDPIYVEAINFRFFNLTIEILDVYMKGFRNFKLEKSNVDKDGRYFLLKENKTTGDLQDLGRVPLPAEDQHGGRVQDVRHHPAQPRPGIVHRRPEVCTRLRSFQLYVFRLSADKVFITAKIKLGPNGDRVQVEGGEQTADIAANIL